MLGLETDELVAVAGESQAQLAAYLPGAVRLTVDGESCPSRDDARASPSATTASPTRASGWRWTCPAEQGQFKVDYDLPMENVVDYKLGGAEGTFLFDPDHTVMTADSPGFPRFVEKGVEHIVLGWDHVVFLIILLLGASKLRDVIELATAFTRRPQRHARARASSAWSTSRARSSSR